MDDPSEERRKQAHEETSRLLKEGDKDALMATAAQRVLETVEDFVDAICSDVVFNESSHFNVSLLLRCVARKTQESLMSITGLVDRQQAYYATPLLRPMCEELIFVRFMKTLPRKEADEYLWNRVILDLLKGLRQQRDFFDEAQKEYPVDIKQKFKPHRGETQDLESRIKEQTRKLKTFGKKHGWGNSLAPTVEYMARASNSNAEYEFFYRATSSAVHANLHHLGRMV